MCAAIVARSPASAQAPVKVALVACMHKLLIIANAIIRDGRPWDALQPVII